MQSRVVIVISCRRSPSRRSAGAVSGGDSRRRRDGTRDVDCPGRHRGRGCVQEAGRDGRAGGARNVNRETGTNVDDG